MAKRKSPTETQHIIETHNLTKEYGFGRGVFDVSISVDRGEVFGFLGPNGAGKSTTIRHLMGFSKANIPTAHIMPPRLKLGKARYLK